MFLCDKCHDPDAHFVGFRSWGRCEGCSRTAFCIDCHYARCTPKKKPKAKKKP